VSSLHLPGFVSVRVYRADDRVVTFEPSFRSH
jgi:hypothetical protein